MTSLTGDMTTFTFSGVGLTSCSTIKNPSVYDAYPSVYACFASVPLMILYSLKFVYTDIVCVALSNAERVDVFVVSPYMLSRLNVRSVDSSIEFLLPSRKKRFIDVMTVYFPSFQFDSIICLEYDKQKYTLNSNASFGFFVMVVARPRLS